MKDILTTEQLEDELSRPTPGVLETLRGLEGDILILGAGANGPTLARMARRGLDGIGQAPPRDRGVALFLVEGR